MFGGLGIDGLFVHRLLLLLLLDFIRGVGLGALRVLDHLEVGLLHGQLVVLLGDDGLVEDAGVVGLLRGLRLGDGDVALGLRLGDGGLLADLEGVVRTEVLDKSLVVRDILDIARNHLDAELRHVGGGLLGDLVGEPVTVDVEGFEVERADNLTHVTLQGVLDLYGDILLRHVEEVFGSQTDTLVRVDNADLRNGIHDNRDEVIGRDRSRGLDIDARLSEEHLIDPFETGDAESAFSDENTGLARKAGDDVGVFGRCLHVADGKNHNNKNDSDSD